MTVFLLKIIAVITMLCDHTRRIFPGWDTSIMQLLGRIAFPIFAFLITESYIHTKNLKKFLVRLGIFAIISQIPFLLFLIKCGISDEPELNVMFTFLFGVICIALWDKEKNGAIKIISILLIGIMAYFCKVDYGVLGVYGILLTYIFKDNKYVRSAIIPCEMIVLNVCQCIKYNVDFKYIVPFLLGYIASSVILLFYNGKLGKYKLKYFYYLFYPLHMVILFLIYKFYLI